ncbi:hypothetical protein ACF8LH_13130 [Pseudomonas sp. zbq_4]|uniref:hypothetical protein n=1 Tax=Pseudomonas sp. zbq_4 TaxID=3367240 RepID=UPI00370C545B
MDQVEIKGRESSIVLIGTFNPLEMAPHWFVKHGLIPQEDVNENLDVDIVYSEMTKFTIADIIIEVHSNKLVLRSGLESLDYRIHDLALGVLSILKKPGITALGINAYNDWYFEDIGLWHKIGDLLAPKNAWLEAVPDSPRAGLAKLQMQVRKQEGQPGIYNFGVSWLEENQWLRFTINDHYDQAQVAKNPPAPHKKGSKAAVFDPAAIISSFWQYTLDFQKHVVGRLIQQAKECDNVSR